MKKIMTLLAACATCLACHGQDLMNLLDDGEQANTPVIATFKSTRIVNGHTIECTPRHHLDFRINHRFGELKSGFDGFFGLDQATMRLGFDYGITENLMIGVGRSTTGKVLDGFAKYRMVRQTNTTPLTVALLGGSYINTQERRFSDPSYELSLANRSSFISQVLVARKFSSSFSAQLMPTVLHRNLVATRSDENTVLAVGAGARQKLTRSLALTGEYYYNITEQDKAGLAQAFSIGVDIETGGHVFQLQITNSLGTNELQAIGETTGSWGDGEVRFGFNLVRTFSLSRRP